MDSRRFMETDSLRCKSRAFELTFEPGLQDYRNQMNIAIGIRVMETTRSIRRKALRSIFPLFPKSFLKNSIHSENQLAGLSIKIIGSANGYMKQESKIHEN